MLLRRSAGQQISRANANARNDVSLYGTVWPHLAAFGIHSRNRKHDLSCATIAAQFCVFLGYALAELARPSIASQRLGKVRNRCCTRVISNTLETRSFTPTNAIHRPAFCSDTYAPTIDPSPTESI